MALDLRETEVTIDDAEWRIPCRISGHLWSGWQMPYFTKEQADRVVEHVNSAGCELYYDEAKDAYIYKVEDYPDEEPEEFGAVEVGGVKYYAIGAGSWCWDIADPTSTRSRATSVSTRASCSMRSPTAL